MATLHVRNFPDDVYELLRERAAANDRSIGAEAIQLLHERLALAGYRGPRTFEQAVRRRPPQEGRLTRFTSPARQAVVAAQDVARERSHQHVGTDHLLLGVVAAAAGTPLGDSLAALGLTEKRAARELTRVHRKGHKPSPSPIPFEPGARQALELALREALKLGDETITPTHILLGVLGQETGKGAAILRAVEPDAEKIRRSAAVSAALPPGPGMRLRPRPVFRVVALDGDTEAWERQLNDAASLGFDLVEIVDRRAILRRV